MSSTSEHSIYYTAAYSHGSNNVTFCRPQINATIIHALTLLEKGEQIGEDKYPRAYKQYHHYDFEDAEGPFFEFPILLHGVYDGSASPGPDRVVFGSVSRDYKTANYAGIAGVAKDALPPGASGSGGAPHIFPDTSVNLDPKVVHQFGDPEHIMTGVSKEHSVPPKGRELLRDEDVKIVFHELVKTE
ncbi:guanine-specific ribonuclease n1/t1 [Niveomyces insectorum RCEF 264]|uniref:ribonuclease T1 n=1 Tax=Niveomyces insectorum RCEF 264 TaxID=1081102 RepID=A0A167RC47_9HYPO|nr:guanine-specific ribonuclease n1/t1 [Niveomyces insectorum RCEF 264]